MQYKALYTILQVAYEKLLRELLLNAIDNPDSEVDEMILKIADGLFGYKKPE